MTIRPCVWPRILALAGLLPLAGCSATDVILPAYYELRGAKGTIQWIEEPPVGALDKIQTVYFEPLSNSLGRKLCPPRLIQDYDRTAARYERSQKGQSSGGASIKVAGDVVYFQNKGLLSGALLLVRVKITADDRQLGDGLLRVESQSFREGSSGDLAEAAVSTLAKYLARAKE
jgi:hypothetical protein